MTWILESRYESRVVPYLDEISNNYCNKNVTVADSYYALLVRSSGTLTALQADHNDFEATTQIPNLNIQTKGVPHTQQMTEPKQITLVKRESHTPKQKESLSCLLCGGNHLAHRCAKTCQVRDRDIHPPNQLCLKHCGKKTEACKDSNTDKYYIFRKKKGQLVDLTCG